MFTDVAGVAQAFFSRTDQTQKSRTSKSGELGGHFSAYEYRTVVPASLLSEVCRMRSCSILLKGRVCIWIHLTGPWHEAIFQYFFNGDLFVDFNAFGNKN